MRPEAILFDLFGTLVSIDARRLPRVRVGGRERATTLAQAGALLARLRPKVELERLLGALESVSAAMEEEKLRRGHVELSSRERFVRALESLELSGPVVEVAEEMSERHMAGLAAAVVCPPGRRELLAALAGRHRVGLISNFDHGSTARALLERHGLATSLDPIVVSDDVGVRKPGRRIFEIACERLTVEPARCLYVGDSYTADVEGATAAGLEVLWIDDSDADRGPARGKIADVSHLPAWLARAGRADTA